MAFRYGPGGPINALVGTQVIYQTLLNALFFDQALSSFQFYGITAGVTATIVISSGDEIFDYLRCRKSVSTKEDHEAELLEGSKAESVNELK